MIRRLLATWRVQPPPGWRVARWRSARTGWVHYRVDWKP